MIKKKLSFRVAAKDGERFTADAFQPGQTYPTRIWNGSIVDATITVASVTDGGKAFDIVMEYWTEG